MNRTWRSGDLDRFSNSFKNEDQLREVLRDLLIRSGATGVRITHGPNERGKDLIFYRDGGLSRDVLYACVVKNSRITGSVSSPSGSPSVMRQAAQALDEPYTDRVTGKDVSVHSVYVVSPFECTNAAVENIKSGLQSHGRRVEFICGINLLSLFEDYWPDYAAISSSSMTRYIVELRAGLSSDMALLAMLTRHNANLGLRPFTSAYVPTDVELRWCQLTAAKVPPPRALPETLHFTWGEIEEITSSLRYWRRAFQTRQKALNEGSEFGDLASTADAFVRLFRGEWSRSSASQRNRNGRPGHEERRLAIARDWQDQYEHFRKAAAHVRRELISVERRANALHERLGLMSGVSRELLTSDAVLECVAVRHHVVSYPELWHLDDQFALTVSTDVLSAACRAYVLVGPPGSGKTSFCRWQALQSVERFLAEPDAALPIYIAAHRLTAVAISTIEDLGACAVEIDRILV